MYLLPAETNRITLPPVVSQGSKYLLLLTLGWKRRPILSHCRPMKSQLIACGLGIFHVLGFTTALNALMTVRTSQGTIAWVVSLLTFPVLSVPAYWIFGRSKFRGYVALRGQLDSRLAEARERIREKLRPFVVESPQGAPAAAAARLAKLPYLKPNSVELLIDGERTFASILEGIDAAKAYVLVQFYIVRDDVLGKQLKEKLKAAAKRGVKTWFLYDEIGSSRLGEFTKELANAGVAVSAFQSTRGSGNRFQLNFRNHRKIVVVDGHSGWVGGHNVGDEYLGRDPKFPNWRDTHVKISGPAVLQLQLSFLEDWHWAQSEILELPWEPRAAGDTTVLVAPTGPADTLETCSLLFQQAIQGAKKRFWIASPYFVPDQATIAALLLASLRGVDVRILIPEKPDNKLVYYSAYAFLGPLLDQGIKIYRYQPGFLHEKVFLIDDHGAGVGTANLDNRSFRLNFEVTAIIGDERFAKEMEHMFERDFESSRTMTAADVREKSLGFRLLARASYLTAPIQ